MSWLSDKFSQLQSAFTFFTSASAATTSTEYDKLKVIELKALAKEKGLKGYTSLRKAELIQMLQQN
jgi:hypothetical protein